MLLPELTGWDFQKIPNISVKKKHVFLMSSFRQFVLEMLFAQVIFIIIPFLSFIMNVY